MNTYQIISTLICIWTVYIGAVNDSNHDVWDVISQYSDTNSSQNLRLTSTGNKKWIDEKFQILQSLLNKFDNTSLVGVSVVQYTRLLFQIHDLTQQHPILKYMLSTKPELFTKLLFPQIKYGLIITTDLRLNKNISSSTNFIEHFYHHLTSIEYPTQGAAIRSIGRLFALKFMDTGYKHQLHAIKSADILKLITVKRNLLRYLLFDGGVLDIIFNPVLYPSLDTFGYELSKTLQRYLTFKGVPQWIDADALDIPIWRQRFRFSFRDVIVTHMEYLWLTRKDLFRDPYQDNLQHFAELLVWIRKALGYAYNEIMGPLCMTILRTANVTDPTDLLSYAAFSNPVNFINLSL